MVDCSISIICIIDILTAVVVTSLTTFGIDLWMHLHLSIDYIQPYFSRRNWEPSEDASTEADISHNSIYLLVASNVSVSM